MKWTFASIALVAGAGLATQTGLNSMLRARMGSPILAALTSFSIGTLTLVLYVAATRPEAPAVGELTRAPWWIWMGGVLGAGFVASAAAFAVRLGAHPGLGLVVAGQILTSILLDHYGLVGFPVRAVSPGRILGAILLLTGVLLVLRS